LGVAGTVRQRSDEGDAVEAHKRTKGSVTLPLRFGAGVFNNAPMESFFHILKTEQVGARDALSALSRLLGFSGENFLLPGPSISVLHRDSRRSYKDLNGQG
jgi:hypothetical protein